MLIKICGIRTIEAAAAAVEAGADAVGFVFAPSRRRIDPAAARAIGGTLPRSVLKVGVFVDEKAPAVAEIAAFCGLDLLQFHGRESPEYCREFGGRAIKALRPRETGDLAAMDGYRDVFAFLIDTYDPELAGGSGRTGDWGLAGLAAGRAPVILAGGLDPGNVVSALDAVGPFGVDTSSGVEADGVKDPDLIRQFVTTVRRWELEHSADREHRVAR